MQRFHDITDPRDLFVRGPTLRSETISGNESPLNFIFKAVFILKIFNFCPDFFSHAGKRLSEKVMINFKMYDVTEREKIISTHVFPNISRNKGN